MKFRGKDQGPDLSLVLACYNESEILEGSLSELKRWAISAPFSVELIFVDDKSADDTVRILEKGTADWDADGIACRILRHPANRGRGAAVRSGLAACRGKVHGYIDIDFEIPLANVNKAYEVFSTMHGPTFLVASRSYEVGGLYSEARRVLSRGYRWLARRRFRLAVTDSEAGFKFFSAACTPVILSQTFDNGWFWDTEVCRLAQEEKWRLEELPCAFHRRGDKTSKVNIVKDVPVYLSKLLTGGK